MAKLPSPVPDRETRLLSSPLLSEEPVQKRKICFGYLPMWSECVPMDAQKKLMWPRLATNVFAGMIIGLREALGGIVSASLIFSSCDNADVQMMFPFGIGLMWYTTAFGTLWYAVFGRLQYAYCIAQDVIGILQSALIAHAAERLSHTPERIAPTAFAIISVSAVITGITQVLVGKLGLGRYMLLFPTPVTSSFLGAIGIVILRSSLQTSSGVKFQYFYPVSMDAFMSPKSYQKVLLQLVTVTFVRLGPKLLDKLPGMQELGKFTGILCQLFPLALFWIVVLVLGVSMDELARDGWTYPRQGSGGMDSLWSSYDRADADFSTVLAEIVHMGPIVMMALLCTMTGVLGITDSFPGGPDGDPAPLEPTNFDSELTTVGTSSILLGLTGGSMNFHTFSAIQLRIDGGTHRVAVFALALFLFTAFASSAPIGQFIPKWFLSALFMNTALHFIEGAIFSYSSMPRSSHRLLGVQLPSPQYAITLCGLLVAVFSSPMTAIWTGLVLSVLLFLFHSVNTDPVFNVLVGDAVVSRTKRPVWEMRSLTKEGNRIVLLYLQGHLFFGSVRKLAATVEQAAASNRTLYVILSFGRVSMVDPSAARHLKTSVDRAEQRGCKVLCCRMNPDVFSAMKAAGVVRRMDSTLSKIMYPPVKLHMLEQALTAHYRHSRSVDLTSMTQPWSPTRSQAAPEDVEPDSFAHETDALDYCDDRIVAKYCYEASSLCLKPYMLAYWKASTMNARLDETMFEQMVGLPAGFMDKIRPLCQIRKHAEASSEVEGVDDALIFILRGGLALVRMVAQLPQAAQAPNQEWLEDYKETTAAAFSFRKGKHLLKRYPPGYIVGKTQFFLHPRGQAVDDKLHPRPIVSTRLGPEVEFWIMQRPAFDSLSTELRMALVHVLCEQMADDSQHSRFQEH